MLEVMNNSVTLVRGDSGTLKADIVYSDGKQYVLQDGDVLKFTMRKKVESEEIVLQKTLEDGILHIVSNDTVNLEFGVYVYDIVLLMYTGDVFTIIPTSNFKISQEVHN